MCERCMEYDIVSVFQEAEPLDAQELYGWSEGNQLGTNTDQEQKSARYELKLGHLPLLLLDPVCPLCRLIYRILPREGLNPKDDTLKLVPYRSYLRVFYWERLSVETKCQTAIMLGLFNPYSVVPVMTPLVVGGGYTAPEQMTGEAVCLLSKDTFPGRTRDNGRLVSPLVDIKMLKQSLDRCLDNCQYCHTEKHAALRRTRMVDVIYRVTVPCPEDCDYFALSYVWGSIIPKDGALATGGLPQTIEDAITLTRHLGRRYLWVDALCIDQIPNLTPEQAAAKAEELGIMDLIYGCATLTVVATSGLTVDAGLPGLRDIYPRERQIEEVIDGRTFFTVPPTVGAQEEVSVYDGRAWTLQEEVLSKRKLYFTDTQARFQYLNLSILESVDNETTIEWPLLPGLDNHWRLHGVIPHPIATVPDAASAITTGHSNHPKDWFIHGFIGLLQSYTDRKMTHESDSLNALLGIISAWEKNFLSPSSRFVCGLPLRNSPQFLAWMHDRNAGLQPKRRQAFPSWSWAGWEGRIEIDPLLPEEVYSPEQCNRRSDLTVQVVDDLYDDKVLVVEGWVVDLEIRTEPFSEAYIPGTEEVIGIVKERNFIYNNMLLSGIHTCLVVERARYVNKGFTVERERVFMVVLDWYVGASLAPRLLEENRVAKRRTMITLSPAVDGGFIRLLQGMKRRIALV